MADAMRELADQYAQETMTLMDRFETQARASSMRGRRGLAFSPLDTDFSFGDTDVWYIPQDLFHVDVEKYGKTKTESWTLGPELKSLCSNLEASGYVVTWTDVNFGRFSGSRLTDYDLKTVIVDW